MGAEVLKLLALVTDEIVLLVLLLVLFPRFGVRIPLWAALTLVGVLLAKDVAIVPYVLKGGLEGKPEVGPESLLGKTAVAAEDLSPEGLVKVDGELWMAECRNGRVKRGERVRVVGIKGTRLLVERRVR